MNYRAADETWESFQRSPAWDQSDADLCVAEQHALPAGKTHIAGQCAMPRVRPQILAMLTTGLGYVEMGDQEIGIRRLEHHDLHCKPRLFRRSFGE